MSKTEWKAFLMSLPEEERYGLLWVLDLASNVKTTEHGNELIQLTTKRVGTIAERCAAVLITAHENY